MAYLVTDGLVNVTPTVFGGHAPTASTALLEPWGDPQGCGLYQRPQGPGGVVDYPVVVSAAYSVVGIQQRARARG